MQVKLNQYEIQQFLREGLQKRHATPITLTAFDLKGMRSEEGYHANVEFEYADVDYGTTVPKVVSFAKEHTESSSEPETASKSTYTPEEYAQISQVLNLLQGNVNHSNSAQIISLVQNASENIQEYFKSNSAYIQTKVDFETQQASVQEEQSQEESTEPVNEPVEVKTVNPVESVVYVDNPKDNATVKLNIFGKPLAEPTTTPVQTQAVQFG